MTDTSRVFRPLSLAAWQALTQYPWLLFFGFCTSILGLGGFWELFFNIRHISLSATDAVATFQAMGSTGALSRFLQGIIHALTNTPVSALIVLLFFCAIAASGLLVFWIAAIGHGALIDTAHKTSRKLRTTFAAGWVVGRRFSWRILGIHLILKATLLGLFFGIGILLVATMNARGIFFALSFVLFLLLIACALIIVLLTMYTAAYSVIRGFSLTESFTRALHLFTTHWLISIEFSLITFLVSFALGLITLLTLLLITTPFLFIVLIFATLQPLGGVGLLMIIWILVALALFAFASALFTAWQTLAWTMLFIRITEEGATAKIIRITRRWFA